MPRFPTHLFGAGAGLTGATAAAGLVLGGLADPAAAAALAAAAGLAGALAQQSVARRRSEDLLRGEVAALGLRHDAVARELEHARGEMRDLLTALQQTGHGGGAVKEVIGELRVLQRLVEQLWARQRADTAEPAAAPAFEPLPAEPQASTPEPQAAPLDEATVLDCVRSALSAGRVELFLQPVVALPQRRRRFYECLSRIRAADGTLIRPEDYMPLVAREGLLPAIDNLLLFRCIQLIRRAKAKTSGLGFFCNISRHSLADADFIADFTDFLAQNQELATSLIFEVAQADLDLADPALCRHLDLLGESGIRFSLDNVTDLALDLPALSRNHVRFVKIDAGRFEGADPDGPWDGSLFQLRRHLLHHDIALVLEKIESERQLVELLEFGVELGQGYLFGEPRLSPEAA